MVVCSLQVVMPTIFLFYMFLHPVWVIKKYYPQNFLIMHVIYLFIYGLLNCGFGGDNASRGGTDQIQLHITKSRYKMFGTWILETLGKCLRNSLRNGSK